MDRTNRRRSLALVTLLSLAGCAGSDGAHAPSDAPGRPGPSEAADGATGTFQDLNGVTWLYTTENETRFADVTAQLDDFRSRGIRVLGIYAPYDGDKAKWLGCAPRDFYTTSPASGTVDDFRALVRGAHERGMKIVAYFVSIYIDRASEFFRRAERQYRDGDRTSREVSAFHWTDDPKEPLPEPAAGPECGDPELEEEEEAQCTQWRYSETAGAYYWSLWGEAGFDYNLPGARAEVERAMKFWLDTGLDGFMFDAAFAHPKFQQLMAELPKRYTANDKWLTFESAHGEDQRKLDAFGLTSWFNGYDEDTDNDYSYVARGSDTVDDLERSLRKIDFARERGKTTFAWSVLEGRYPDEVAMRAQEAALLGGAGMLYGAPSERDRLERWPAEARARWEDVLVTLNANAALLPSASRKRLGAGSDPKAYAMMRTSKDGGQTALLVYNLKRTADTIPVDLAGSGIARGQRPRDLHRGREMPRIEGDRYELDLPPYGFEILEVTRE